MSEKTGTPATRKADSEPAAPPSGPAPETPADAKAGNGAAKTGPKAEDLAFYLQALLDYLPDKIYFKDASSRFVAVSRQVARQFGMEPREVLGKSDFDLFTKEHAEQAFRDEQEIIRTGVPLVNFEEKETLPQGGIRWVSSTKMPLRDKQGRTIGTFGLSRDITDRKRMEEQLVRRTFYDALTGLPNRALFLNRLDQLCQENTRGLADTRAFAVISLNLDRFKSINESLGHDGGDELILQIAKRWKECLAPSDTLARLGGDEFSVLIEDVEDPGQVTKRADRMLEELAAPFTVRATSVYVSASAGIVISDKTYERADQILRDGDIALHRAKARGPGERQVFDAEMHRQAVLRLQLDTDLRRALERRELSVHYQPIVDARARRVVGFEALVRWRHPEKGLLTPDVFIPVAEATGLIDRLGLIVLEQACRDLRRLESRRAGDPTPLRMSVNLSAAQLRSVRLCEHIRQVLEETGAPPSALIVELTESAILNDKTRARAALDQLRGLGVHIHIDDFGTGYSSLGHLHALPVDALKIDRTFVARLDTKDGSVEIVRAIMALAQALHLEAVAEGVETREQLAILRAMGCSIVQGFLFARTMPVEEAEAWLSNDPLGAF